MKYRLTLFFCLAFTFSSSLVFGQLSKQEKKEWKKKAKEFSKSPESLKQLTEEKQAAESQVSSLNQKVTQMQGQISEKDTKLAQLEDELTQAKGQLTATKAELAQLKETPVINPMDFSKGIVFKVQIGAFKNKDLAKYFDNNPNFGGEVKEGEPQKVTIGIFRDYWEADTFKKYMREMGVKDAWIVPYKDGQRVEIKDVLEGVVNEKPAESSK
ncbi:MAG TPA: Ezrin/radixin/moesin family protein [Ohtaekwangia sp.]|uniref:Ezrin/radixin/moesin family protein n=1 Tax=Ohtaekwangia sp. TaxID=2066019 RepID=UPI002F93E2CE